MASLQLQHGYFLRCVCVNKKYVDVELSKGWMTTQMCSVPQPVPRHPSPHNTLTFHWTASIPTSHPIHVVCGGFGLCHMTQSCPIRALNQSLLEKRPRTEGKWNRKGGESKGASEQTERKREREITGLGDVAFGLRLIGKATSTSSMVSPEKTNIFLLRPWELGFLSLAIRKTSNSFKWLSNQKKLQLIYNKNTKNKTEETFFFFLTLRLIRKNPKHIALAKLWEIDNFIHGWRVHKLVWALWRAIWKCQ